MARVTVVGLTGGVASGKSLVLNLFMNFGTYVIDYDMLSREVVTPCSNAWWEIVNLFGKDILNKDWGIDRKKLRKTVFSHVAKREALEKIIHPETRRKRQERIEAIRKIESELDADVVIVVDIPLLIEKGNLGEFDKIVVVYVSEAVQIRRVMERDGLTEDEAKKMINAQMPLKEKLKFADFVVNNEGTIEATEMQVRKIVDEL
jgi:dephospho-CoA kinase